MTSAGDVEVGSVAALRAAVVAEARRIVVTDDLHDIPSFRLGVGMSLCGATAGIALRFAPSGDGVALSANNDVSSIRLETDVERRAIYNDTSVAGFGVLRITDVTTVGRVSILACEAVRSGLVDIAGLDIEAADARAERLRPQGFGVGVLQGAFTLWNRQDDPGCEIIARLRDIRAGRDGAPVRGSGVFVAGAGNAGGRVVLELLETGPVYSDGGIAPGTSDTISGGVFTVHGCHATLVRTLGPVTTYGVNDMVLDNWGEVDSWRTKAAITSHGPSAIGFVNFGRIDDLRVDADIETYGVGARGFNVYDGHLDSGEFSRIVTHGDGAVGVQISRPMRRLVIRDGIETHGAVGESLVKGVVAKLPAVPLSLKIGASVEDLDIGALIAHAPGIPPLEINGSVGALRIDRIDVAPAA